MNNKHLTLSGIGHPSECEYFANEKETDFSQNRQKILISANSHNLDFQLTRVGYERAKSNDKTKNGDVQNRSYKRLLQTE